MRKLLLLFLILFSSQIICDAQLMPTQSMMMSKRESAFISTIADATPQSVTYNTAFGSLSLPSTRDATLSNGQIVTLTITWNSGTYSATSAGIQTIYGDATVPNWITNPFLVQAIASVNVQEQITTETLTAPTGGQAWTVPAGVDTITTASGIGSGATGSSVATITRGPGGGGGAFALKNTIPVTSGDLIALYIGPNQQGPLPSGTDLDGLPGRPSYFGPAVPSGSTILFGSGAPGGGTGSDGNYYSDFLTGELYGPKASGSWPGSPASPYMRAAGGTNGTGFAPGTGGAGGTTANSIGDTKYAGGSGIAAPASRSGAGGGAAGKTGAGANGTTSGSTNSVGGVGNSPGGNGGNGSATVGTTGSDYGGGGAGSRNTATGNTRGGSGAQGWIELVYSGSSVPPADPGNAYLFSYNGQSNTVSPPSGTPLVGNGPYSMLMWINTSTGFSPLEYGVNNNSNSGGSTVNRGAEMGVADALEGDADGDVYITKKGQSGTSMYSNWNISTNSTGRTAVTQDIQTLDYLVGQGKDVLEFINLFRQGEADLNSSNPWGSATYLYGTGVPSSGLGITGDAYLDKTNNLLYGLKSSYGNTNWASGFQLYTTSGSGSPSSGTSTIGACYWDSTNDQFYIKTGTSTWTSVTEQDAVVRSSYLTNYYKLIKYKIDQIEANTAIDFTVTEFNWIDLLTDNTTSDNTYQIAVVGAKKWAMGNFDADNSSYAARTVPFSTVTCASCSTSDGVHLTTPSQDAYGPLIKALISIP